MFQEGNRVIESLVIIMSNKNHNIQLFKKVPKDFLYLLKLDIDNNTFT